MRLPVTQDEIARRVGISQQAVSYVLGKHSSRSRIRVRPEVRRKVLRAARRLGYRPNRLAQAVRKGRSGMIGMLSFHGASEVAARRASCAAKSIHAAGYHLLAVDAAWYAGGIREAIETLMDARVEGILVVTPTDWFSATMIREARALGVPLVCLSGAPISGAAQVRADVRQGMALLVRHLLDLGHRRLMLAARPPSSPRAAADWTTRERMEGFQDAVSAFRREAPSALLPAPEARVIRVPPAADVWTPYECGAQALRVALRAESRPDALLCSNDEWALGALGACHASGISVPGDLAVTGFDGSAVGAHTSPPLTTIAQPQEEIARRGVDLLLRQVRGEPLAPEERLVKLSCALLVRASCGAPSSNAPFSTPFIQEPQTLSALTP